MKTEPRESPRRLVPFLVLAAPFAAISVLTGNLVFILLTGIACLAAAAIVVFGLYRAEFEPDSPIQKGVFALLILTAVLFSFFLCAVSIEGDWLYSYPLEGSADDYGCYPQLFDAFRKGQLHIDTELDLSVYETVENIYDPQTRAGVSRKLFDLTWDRAYYNGRLYSYFGAAPVVLLYFPAFFLTGKVLSDALAAAILSAIGSALLMLLFRELCKRTQKRVPFALVLLGAAAIPCGALIWSTQTCANFYHIAVQSGICAIASFFYFVLKAEERRDGALRKLLFALAGVSAAATVASRPTMAIYCITALPTLFSIIKKHPFGIKSLSFDIASFCVPMFALGGLIMAYNYARFASPFEFGARYQLTLADVSQYRFSPSLIIPALFHYFCQMPVFNKTFPYVHPSAVRLKDYGVGWKVYTSSNIGALFFPASWGVLLTPQEFRNGAKRGITALAAVLAAVAVAIFDISFGGVHLRYTTDIAFILALLGGYLLVCAAGNAKKGSRLYVFLCTAAALLFVLTILAELPVCFDNERDMIKKFHPLFYRLIEGF